MIINKIKEPVFGVLTYVIIENGHCIVIDPILTKRFKKIVSDFIIDYAFVTHEHYDHIRDIDSFKKYYKSPVLCGGKAKKGLLDSSLNLSRYLDYLIEIIPFGNHKIIGEEYCCSCDKSIEDNQTMVWENHIIVFKETPGHSKGSVCLLIDSKYLFCGDTLFKDCKTATKIPGGSTKIFKTITEPWLDSLPDNVLVYPGHGKSFKLKNRIK